MKHLYDKDVASGLMFAAIGLFSLALSCQFDFGTSARPGAGFFPTVLSILLILIGVLVTVTALRSPVVVIAKIVWRPFVFITLAVVAFGVLINPFGLIPSVITASLIGSFAKADFGLVARLATASCLALFSAVLFIGLLNLPIDLWSY
jgi:hypothetical protein